MSKRRDLNQDKKLQKSFGFFGEVVFAIDFLKAHIPQKNGFASGRVCVT